MMQLAQSKVAQSKPGAFRPHVCHGALTVRHRCQTVHWKASARSNGWSTFVPSYSGDYIGSLLHLCKLGKLICQYYYSLVCYLLGRRYLLNYKYQHLLIFCIFFHYVSLSKWLKPHIQIYKKGYSYNMRADNIIIYTKMAAEVVEFCCLLLY